MQVRLLLQHSHVPVPLPQRRRGGKPTEAATHDKCPSDHHLPFLVDLPVKRIGAIHVYASILD